MTLASLIPIAAPTGIYLITPDTLDTTALLKATQAALEGGVRWLQYRNKCANAALRLEQAQALRALTRSAGALTRSAGVVTRRAAPHLIINDDPALAVAVQADGVHLGRDDASVAQARALLGAQAVIGVSAYDDAARAQHAAQAGANYVAFGAVFASTVKPQAVHAPLALLTQARQAGLHVVAIGGIQESNLAQVVAAGAHAAALITAVYDAPDPRAAAKHLVQQFEQAQKFREPGMP